MSDPAPAAEAPRLAQLLAAEALREALAFMREADSGQLRAEVAHASAALPVAASALLRALQLYVEAGRPRRLPQLLEPVVENVTPAHQARLTASDRELAAEMLPAVVAACRMQLAVAFARAYKVDGDRVVAFAVGELLPTNVFAAVQLLDALRLKRAVPAVDIISQVIQQNDIHAGDLFVKGGPREDQVAYVQQLVACNINDKIVKKRLSLFKLDPSEFPEYLKRKQIGALRYMIHSEQYDDALAFVKQAEHLKKYACDMILRMRGPNHAATQQFVFRVGLAAQYPRVDVSGQASLSFEMETGGGKDGSGDSDAFVSLEALIGENNLLFVDTPELLQECVDHLRGQTVIGFDSEWKTVHADATTGKTHSFCALVQIASRDKAFVIDMLKLEEHGAMLLPVLASGRVLVLGFDTRGDLGPMRSLLTNGNEEKRGDSIIISQLVDIQMIAKKLLGQALGAPSKAMEEDGADVVEVVDGESGASAATAAPTPKAPHSTPNRQRNEGGKNRRNRNKREGSAANSISLTNIVDLYLGKPLDKRLRMSDWTKRPLSTAQLRYAALDAVVLVHILEKMRETQPPEVLDPILARCMQKNVR